MELINTNDIVPILVSCILFSLLATAHRVLIPDRYSAFLQFKQEEDVKKTVQSTSIRIMYLIIGTILLYKAFNFNEKQIAIGIFIACFLNVWPAIIQNQLLKFIKNKAEWLLLIGYVAFIFFSILVSLITIKLLLPILMGNKSLYWLDNQAISIISTIAAMAVPIPIEAVLAKFTHIVVVQTIDTFIEEIYILQNQLNMGCKRIDNNKYYIDDIAKKYDINEDLLITILKLEKFYRDRLYNRFLEVIICKWFGFIAIKRNITVGLAQIKISTAEKLLRENPEFFVNKLTSDKFNIDVCGKFLKMIITKYNDLQQSENDYELVDYDDVYDYIACEYLGDFPSEKGKTTLVYSAILRSVLSEQLLCYIGSENSDRYHIVLNSTEDNFIPYDVFTNFKENTQYHINNIVKEIFVPDEKLEFEFICRNAYCVKLVREFAEQHNCEVYFL